MDYAIRRILINIPILFIVTVIIFLLVNLAPGDPVDFYVNEEMGVTRDDLTHLEEKFGLNDPIYVRYFKWLGATLQGDLGFRYKNGDDVAEVLFERLQRTLLLMGAALLLGVVIGVTLGIYTGLHQYSIADFLLTTLSFVGISMPAFIAGIFGLYFFSVKLGWFPSGGMRTIGKPETLLDLLHHLVLPAGTLAIMYAANFMRYQRFSILEVKRADYIRTAQAKGLKPRIITWRHTVRNAILPVVTVIGVTVPNLVAGALFTETIYSWPGMGSLFVDAVAARDYPMVMGIMLVTAVVVLGANLITDLTYSLVDPRIRYD
ncbi:MAG: ABC transporter permease [Caldilineaceae bacterium]|nr:ABC transporter permease [Caldilineaceae bacterium]MCB9137545.1 ABC transporter permease [Caldilineaceae bacterium]